MKVVLFSIGLSCIALSSSAEAQTLDWTIETHSSTLSGGDSHQRPLGLKPFHVTPNGACRAKHTVLVHYDVTLNNLQAQARTLHARAIVTATLWGGGSPNWWNCWQDSDPDGVWETIASTTVPGNSSVTLSGSYSAVTNTYNVWRPMFLTGTPTVADCTADGLHDGSFAFTPSFFAGSSWQGIFQAGVDDHGTFLENFISFQTDYELPLVSSGNGCLPTQTNSTGQLGALSAFGVADVSDGLVVLQASSLPVGQAGYFLVGEQGQSGTPLGSGLGTLCLGGAIHRWHASLAIVPASGTLEPPIEPDAVPVPGGITAGSTWHFQLWHRDLVGGQSSSNTTGGVAVSFQ